MDVCACVNKSNDPDEFMMITIYNNVASTRLGG